MMSTVTVSLESLNPGMDKQTPAMRLGLEKEGLILEDIVYVQP